MHRSYWHTARWLENYVPENDRDAQRHWTTRLRSVFDDKRPRDYRGISVNQHLENLFTSIADFPPPSSWKSSYWTRQLFKQHKDRKERFLLFRFFVLNGMAAHSAVFWTMFHGGYDSSAWFSILDAYRLSLSAKGMAYLESLGPVWDVNRSRVIERNVHSTDFQPASSWRYPRRSN